MANPKSHKLAYTIITVVFVTVLLVGTGLVDLQKLNIGQSNAGGGGIQTPPSTSQSSGKDFTGQLTMTIVHRDALDNTESRTEATNVASTYYKSTDGKTYQTLGSGTAVTISIDSSMGSVLYVGESVPAGQAFFVAPSATADKNINPRLIGFEFKDVTNDGQKEWLFKFDLKDMPPPVAGQTASTLSIYINSYDDGASTLNAPTDINSISTTAGTQTFVRWEETVGAETADPLYEYEVKINATNTALWDRGRTTLDIPNLGITALSDFAEQQDGTSTIYKYTLGATLEKANFVTTPQNGNTVHPIPLKFVSNMATSGSANDNLLVTLTLRSMTAAQGTASVNDAIRLSSE